MMEIIIEKMKTTDADIPLVLVGGGSAIIPEYMNF